jgi:prevent-host-death family protein
MEEVGIETLKARLSEYLERARRGERIVITEGGRSIALLSPGEESTVERRAWELVRTGAASWSGGKPQGSRQRPKLPGNSASDIVLENRR